MGYKQLWKHIVSCQSKESPILSNDTTIKILSLFNFLSYLLSVDTVLIPPYEHEKPLRFEEFGYCFDGVFYVNSQAEKSKLIQKYYSLLNNRRNFLRCNFADDVRNGHSTDRSKV